MSITRPPVEIIFAEEAGGARVQFVRHDIPDAERWLPPAWALLFGRPATLGIA